MAAITDLSALTAIADSDLLVVHDVSAATDKKITRTDLMGSPIPLSGFLIAHGTATIANTSSSGLTTILPGAPSAMNGFLFVVNSSVGTSAQFYLRGGFAVAVEMSDPSGTFSATAGTASSTNLYYSGGYGIQNNTGVSVTYFILYIGAA